MSGNGVRSGVGMERNNEGMNNRCKEENSGSERESGSQIKIFLVEFSKIEERGREGEETSSRGEARREEEQQE